LPWDSFSDLLFPFAFFGPRDANAHARAPVVVQKNDAGGFKRRLDARQRRNVTCRTTIGIFNAPYRSCSHPRRF
jgi:hypothetical protein